MSRGNWLFLKCQNIKPFVKGHNLFFKVLRKYIIAPDMNEKDTNLYYSELDRKYFNLYGYRFVKDNYNPHITLGKLSNSYFLNNFQFEKKERKRMKSEIEKVVNNFGLEVSFKRLTYHDLGELGSLKKGAFFYRNFSCFLFIFLN